MSFHAFQITFDAVVVYWIIVLAIYAFPRK